jgi:hypothetical protein
MTTNNPPYVPTIIQHPQHNFVQNPQVCITYVCDVPLLSYISIQTLGGRDHELSSNEYPSIDSASAYPVVNHADALPPTRVSVHFISLHAPFADGGCPEGRWTASRERKSTST